MKRFEKYLLLCTLPSNSAPLTTQGVFDTEMKVGCACCTCACFEMQPHPKPNSLFSLDPLHKSEFLSPKNMRD
jgi:hypothetical protein